MSVTALAAREKLRGGLGQAKVRRYWPGKAPEWSETEGHDHEDVLMRNKADVLATTTPYDQRLQRLTKTITENRELVRQEAEIVSTEEPRDSEEDDAIDETRGRIREKNLKRDQEEEASLLPIEVDEEEASEYETDSEEEEEEEMCHITMIKPVFVQRDERDTIAEREMLEAKEQALEELAKRALEMRKLETKLIVVEEVKNYEEIRKNLLSEEASNGDVETDDEVDEAQEYKVWKTREIARTKRQRDASEAIMQEVDKLKKMTEHEKNDPELLWKDKPKKRKFMQRYYHKGAFFQETGSADGIFDRDFSAPTGEDKLDRTKLRKVMQVKRFGRSVRSKWTHLVNEDTTYDGKNTKREDTTDWADLWITNCFLREKYKKKIAAMDGPIAKPKGNKKMKVWENLNCANI